MIDVEHTADPRWALLETARPALLDKMHHHGVHRIEFVASFPHSDGFTAWLCTSTDADRDAIAMDDPLVAEVRTVLLQTGFTPGQLVGFSVVTQSQETVDRDFDGSWFYALR